MKKIWVLLFATLMVPSLSFADGSNAAKINLVKKLYRTDAQGYATGETYSKYASPEFKKTIKQAYHIIESIERRTGDTCDMAEHYDQRLVAKELQRLGQNLRTQLSEDIQTILALSSDGQLMGDLPWIADSIALRNVYTDPLNLLQVELLARLRQTENPDPELEQALMITITGIAAGMRNTG